MRIVLWHHSRILAQVQGLYTDGDAPSPYLDAMISADVKAVRTLWNARCYEPVAVQQSITAPFPDDSIINELEKIWVLTQHGIPPSEDPSRPWNDQPTKVHTFVPIHHKARFRSSMVGDVAQVFTNSGALVGTYVAAMCGWNTLPEEK